MSAVSLLSLSCALGVALTAAHPDSDRACIIVVGLGGMPEYEENFVNWGTRLQTIFGQDLGSEVHYLDARQQKKEEILQIFKKVSSQPFREIWLFLIGHGNHDGRDYRFNISGPDLTGGEIKEFLDGLENTRTYLVAGTSASGGLTGKLAGEKRVIVTATRNEMERQPPLFMSFFIEAVSSAEADTDKDGRVSLLEAFAFSRQKVSGWFEKKGRIQTEHPLLDDRGELRLGESRETGETEPPNTGTLLASMAYLSAPAEQAYRTLEAKEMASQRQEIEREIEDLKFRKNQLPESEYYRTLEELLVKLATLNQKIEQLEAGP